MYVSSRESTIASSRSVLLTLFLTLFAPCALVIADQGDEEFALAANKYSLGEWQKAAAGFEELLRDYPDHPKAVLSRFFLGESLVQLNRYAEAHEHFLAFVTQSGDEQYQGQATYRVGESAFLSGDHEVAEQWLTRFHQEYDGHALGAYSWPYLGDVYFEREDFAESRKSYSEALTRFPETPLADHCRFGIARIQEFEGNVVESIRFLTLIAEQRGPLADDSVFELIRLSRDAADTNSVLDIVDRYEELVDSGEFRLACRYLAAEAHLARGENDEAYQTILELPPRDSTNANGLMNDVAAGVVFQIATSKFDKSQESNLPPTEAVRFLERICDEWPTSEWGDDSLEMLARIAKNEGRIDDLESYANRFVADYPESDLTAYVKELMGRSQYQRGLYGDAENSFREALASTKDLEEEPLFLANLHYLHGLSLIATGENHDAVLKLLQAQNSVEQFNQSGDLTVGPTRLQAGIQLALGTAYSRTGKTAEAIANREAFLVSQDDGPEAYDCAVDLSMDYLSSGEYASSWQWATWVAARSNAHDRLHHLAKEIAERAFVADEWEIAESAFELMTQDEGDAIMRSEGWSGLAWIAYKRQQIDEAISAFERVSTEADDGPTVAEACYMLGRLVEQQGDSVEALEWYERVGQSDPQNRNAPDSRLRIARIYRHMETPDSLESSLQAYNVLIDGTQPVSDLAGNQEEYAAPTEATQLDLVLYERAWLYREMEREVEAQSDFERLLADYPDSEYWADTAFRVAEGYARDGLYESSSRLLRQIISRDEETAKVLLPYSYYLIAQNSIRDGDWESSLEGLQYVKQNGVDDSMRAAAAYWLGEAYFRLGRHEDAAMTFEGLSKTSIAIDSGWIPTILLRNAQIEALNGRWAEALQLAKEVSPERDSLTQPFELDYLMGRCCSALGRFGEARESYERVVQSPTGSKTETAAKAQWMIGESYFHQDKYEEAIIAFERVEVLYGYPQWQAAAILQSGKCHSKSGDWKQAVKMYARLLREHPDSEFAAEASELLESAQEESRTQ